MSTWPLFSRPTPHAPRPTPDQRRQVVRGPSPAGYCQTPTAEFPMNSPARSGGRGSLVRCWSGRRWHTSPLPGSRSETGCGDVFYDVQPVTAANRRASVMSLRYGWAYRLPGNQIVAQSTGFLSQRTFDPLLRGRLVFLQTLADVCFAMLEHGIDVSRQLVRCRRDRPLEPQSAVHTPKISSQRRV